MAGVEHFLINSEIERSVGKRECRYRVVRIWIKPCVLDLNGPWKVYSWIGHFQE